MSEQDRRVLAVILHADVAGSTELVRQNETLAHSRIQEVFRRFSRLIEDYDGITRELRGDALLAEFSRASDAVCAAVSFQQANLVENQGEDMPMQLRVGIAMGEVVTADNTLTGSGVVLAQRLEQLAEPGGVCIQGAAYETLPDRLPFDYAPLGEQSLKGFSEPVRAFSVTLGPDQVVPAPQQKPKDSAGEGDRPTGNRWVLVGFAVLVVAAVIVTSVLWDHRGDQSEGGKPGQEIAVSEKPSIAVLPFDNLGGDPDQDYFSDGLAEDIITDLSNIPGLFVTARNSSFAYRDDVRSVQEIAALLGVKYLLDGSVRRAEGQVRINARLIDAQSGEHVWSERFDQRLENIFQIQDEVTSKVVSAFEINLETESGGSAETNTFAAYDVLLKALEVQARFTPEDNAAGRALFQQAASIDPAYARAHAGVGLTHAIDVNMNWTRNQQKSIELGLAAVNRALELDPELPRAFFAKGSLLLSARQHAESEVVMRRAVELNPNYADGHAQLAFLLVMSGKHEQSLESIAWAKKLNPLYSALYLYVEGMALFHLERYDKSLALLEVVVSRNPAFNRGHLMLAATYAYLDNLEMAQWSLDEARILSPDLSLADEQADSILLQQTDLDRYLTGLKLAGLE